MPKSRLASTIQLWFKSSNFHQTRSHHTKYVSGGGDNKLVANKVSVIASECGYTNERAPLVTEGTAQAIVQGGFATKVRALL